MPRALRTYLPPPLDALFSARGRRAALIIVLPATAVLALGLMGGGQATAYAAAAITAALGATLTALEPHWDKASDVEAGPFGELREQARLPGLHLLESVPDPLMLVEAGEPDDMADRTVIFANAAARDLLHIPSEGAPLVNALRRPEVLDAVEKSLFQRVDAMAAFEAGGALNRSWRVITRPLQGPPRRQALVVMHDETDARRTERMRADFLANASHELRTPLASLAGFIETLRGHAKDDADARERFLEIMAGQAERMKRLIEDLLSLSRIELSEHVPPTDTCDLAFAAADVADSSSMLLRERGIRIEIDLPTRDEAAIQGDRDQILQVIQNLIDNAAKYSAPGGVVRMQVEGGLSLETLRGAEPGDGRPGPDWSRLPLLAPDRRKGDRFARVTVIDSGPGIDRARLPRLAERFYRVEGQKSGERSGTGLGLAIVKHIVNRHRGGLTVESAPGKGSAFTAYFPMPRLAAAPDEAPVPALAAVTKLS